MRIALPVHFETVAAELGSTHWKSLSIAEEVIGLRDRYLKALSLNLYSLTIYRIAESEVTGDGEKNVIDRLIRETIEFLQLLRQRLINEGQWVSIQSGESGPFFPAQLAGLEFSGRSVGSYGKK